MSNRHVHGLFVPHRHHSPDELPEKTDVSDAELKVRLQRINMSDPKRAANLLDQILGGNEARVRKNHGDFVVNNLLLVRSAVFRAAGRGLTPEGTPVAPPPRPLPPSPAPAKIAETLAPSAPASPPPPAKVVKGPERLTRAGQPPAAPMKTPVPPPPRKESPVASATDSPSPKDRGTPDQNRTNKHRSAKEILAILAEVETARHEVRGSVQRVLKAHDIGSGHVRQWELRREKLMEQARGEAPRRTESDLPAAQGPVKTAPAHREYRAFPESFKRAVWIAYSYVEALGVHGSKTAFLGIFNLRFSDIQRWQKDHKWPTVAAETAEWKGRRYPREFRQAVVTLYDHFDSFGKAGGKTRLLELLGISSSLPYIWRNSVGAFDGESAAPPENKDDPHAQYAALLDLREGTERLDALRAHTTASLLLEPHIAGLRSAIEQITALHCTAHSIDGRKGKPKKTQTERGETTPAEALQEMDMCARTLRERAKDTPAPGILSPLVSKVQTAVTEVMRLTGTPPREDHAEPAAAPAREEVHEPALEEVKREPERNADPPANIQAAAPLDPPPDSSDPSPSPATIVIRSSGETKSNPPRPPSHEQQGRFSGYSRPRSNPEAWRFDDEQRHMVREITTGDQQEAARRNAFIQWARNHFRQLLAVPSVARRAEEIDRPVMHDHLAFELARHQKHLVLPTLRGIRGSPVEMILRRQDISLTRLCLTELPNVIASFDPGDRKENEHTFEQHIRDHLCAHIQRTLEQIRA